MNGFATTEFEATKVAVEVDGLHKDQATTPADYDVVVVGGGISGLTSAWQMRDHAVLLLDDGLNLGGNAQVDSFDGITFPTAGIVIQYPREENATGALLKELGLWGEWELAEEDAYFAVFGLKAMLRNLKEITAATLASPAILLKPSTAAFSLSMLWGALTGRRFIVSSKSMGGPIFAPLFAYLEQFEQGNDKFPSVPWTSENGWTRSEMEMFDSITLRDLLCNPAVQRSLPAGLAPRKPMGNLLLYAVDVALRTECLTLDEVSAYVGLNFLLGYMKNPVVGFPGGNGYIAQRLIERLRENASVELQASAPVLGIKEVQGGYEIRYACDGAIRTATSKSIIWAAPKYHVPELIEGVPDEQIAAIRQIHHHDYAVSGICLTRHVWPQYYGGYIIDGEDDNRDGNLHSWCKGTSMRIANGQYNGAERCVINMLQPIAREADQGKLATVPFKELQNDIVHRLGEILKLARIKPGDVVDIKLWRWPKALVVSKVGQQRDDVFQRASRNVGGIFFANQDSLGMGNIECAVAAADAAAADVKKFLAA